MAEATGKKNHVTYHSGNWNDKHYFAPFLNLAVSNLNHALDELSLQLGKLDKALEGIEPGAEGRIKTIFHNRLSTAEWKRRIDLTGRYFPVVRYLNGIVVHESKIPAREKNRALVRKFASEKEMRTAFIRNFSCLLTALERLKGHFTYYHHDPIDLFPDNDTVYRLMDSLLSVVARDVYIQKAKSIDSKEALAQNLSLDFAALIEEKREQLHRKDLRQKRESPRERSLFKLSNSVLYDAFCPMIGKHVLLKKVRGAFTAAPAGPEDPISTAALVFLCSCFLSRHQMERIKRSVYWFQPKGNVNDGKMKLIAVNWVYSHLNFRGLKGGLNTQFDRASLLVQVLEELGKVPDDLYRVIKDKKEFVLAGNSCCEHHFHGAHGVKHDMAIYPVVRKRQTERFPYLALRYLDEVAGFENLRFQVFAGDYIHDSRVKEADGNYLLVHRAVKERINVFGRLSHVIKAKEKVFRGTPGVAVDGPRWEPFQKPQYNITDGGIYIHLDLRKLGYAKQAEEIAGRHSGHSCREKRKPKAEIVEKVFPGSQVYHGPPTALLSLNELPALLYELLVKKRRPADIEQALAAKVVAQYQKVREFTGTPEQLQDIHLPQNLKRAANKDERDLQKLMKRIARDREEAMVKRIQLRDIERRFKDGGRKHLLSIYEVNVFAHYVARDIKNLFPPEVRAQWKLYEQKQLHNWLTQYPSCRLDIRTLLESKWDMRAAGPFWGPELYYLFKNKTFWEFLHNYFLLKRNLLKQLLETIELTRCNKNLLNQALENAFILYKQRLYTISSLDREKEKLLSQPIVLPRGLFDHKPTFVKGSSLEENPEQFADWLVYLRRQAKADHQVFYDFKRNYTKAFLIRQYEGKYKHVNHLRIKSNMAIRKCMQNDVVLKLIANDLLKRITHYEPDSPQMSISLKKMYVPKEKVNKEKQRAWSQNEGKPVNLAEFIYEPKEVFDKTFTKVMGSICFHKLRLRDLTRAQQLANEDMVKTLDSWHSKPWTLEELENELLDSPNGYEHIQQYEFFKKMHELESGITFKNMHKDAFSRQKIKHDFTAMIVNGVLKDYPQLEESDYAFLEDHAGHMDYDQVKGSNPLVQKASFLILLHGVFSANQLPPRPFYDLMTSSFKHLNTGSFSRFFMNVADELGKIFNIPKPPPRES